MRQIELHRLAKALADGASPQSTVVAKEGGLGLDVVGSAVRAAPAAEIRADIITSEDPAAAHALVKRGFDRVGAPVDRILASNQAIDDHVDDQAVGQREIGIVERDRQTANAQPRETLGTQRTCERSPIAPGQNINRKGDFITNPGVPRFDSPCDRGRRRRHDRTPAVPANDLAGAGIDESEGIVNLGDRADRAPSRLPSVPLAQGDRRRDAFDAIGVGFIELRQKLSGVGRKRLDIAALAFGVQRVDRQRALARAADTRDGDQAGDGQVEVDGLQVVRTEAADEDEARCRDRLDWGRHGLLIPRSKSMR